MEPDARRYLDLLAPINSQYYRGPTPAGVLLPWRDSRDSVRMPRADRPVRAGARPIGAEATARQLRHYDFAPVPARASAAPAVKEILVVDPEVGGVGAVGAALQLAGDVEICTNFRSARARLLQRPPDLLITNLRLEAYNGLHLVLLAAGTRTRCIVFSTHEDIGVARQVQAAGAFFELSDRLPQVLESYVNATLPQHDRRDIAMLGHPVRGGRRCTDQ